MTVRRYIPTRKYLFIETGDFELDAMFNATSLNATEFRMTLLCGSLPDGLIAAHIQVDKPIEYVYIYKKRAYRCGKDGWLIYKNEKPVCVVMSKARTTKAAIASRQNGKKHIAKP